MDIINQITSFVGKEVKHETENIKQVAIACFSAFTNNPMNIRILSPSSEGKTYLTLKVVNLFPEDNVVTLSRVTPQSFTHNFSKYQLIKNGEAWQDIKVALEPLEEQLRKTKDKEQKEKIQQQIYELRSEAYDCIDFRNKVLVFLDNQSFGVWENLKTTLSHDQEFIVQFNLNKDKQGRMKGHKIVTRGFPSVIYCSAKDEQKQDDTNEINTRFLTLSTNSSSKKYRAMLRHEALKSSLPSSMYQEFVSDSEREHLEDTIKNKIQDLQQDIFNPYNLAISELFPSDAGYRTRQLKILENNARVLTLVNSNSRPYLEFDGDRIPVTVNSDIQEAIALTKKTKPFPIAKIKQFNAKIRPHLKGNQKLTASDLLTLSEIDVTRQQFVESTLKPLVEQGFIEKESDPTNLSRDVFYLTPKYENEEAELTSTLIDTSLLDYSFVTSFLDEHIKQRFDNNELTICDSTGNQISYADFLSLIVIKDSKIVPEINSVEVTTNNENNQRGGLFG